MQAARSASMGSRGVLSSAASTDVDSMRRAWRRSESANSAGSARVAQRLVAAILEILIEPPALDLRQSVVEFLPGQRPIIELLATAELRIVPRMEVLEFGRHHDLPQR